MAGSGLRFEGSNGVMSQGDFDAGIRGERGPDRPEDYGPDHRGGELVGAKPDHRCPPGLGGVGLTEVYYDRDKGRELVGAAA